VPKSSIISSRPNELARDAVIPAKLAAG